MQADATTLLRTGTPGPAAPVLAPTVRMNGQQGFPCFGQSLLIVTNSGNIYRTDDYVNGPAPTLVADTAAASYLDVAVDPNSGRVFAVNGSSINFGREIVEIDLATGGISFVGILPEFANSLDFGNDGTMYARNDLGETYRIEVAPYSVTVVNSFLGLGSAGDIALDVDGTFLITTTDGFLERFDAVTGGVPLFDLDLPSDGFGMEVDCDGTIYVATRDGGLYRVNVATQTATLLRNFTLLEDVNGVAFLYSPGVPTPVGANFCGPGIPNSSGASGGISGFGSPLVWQMRVELVASSLPRSSFGFFLASQVQALTPNPGGSEGTLCLGGSIGRYVGQGQIMNSGQSGAFQLDIDLAAIPTPAGPVAVMPGDVWNFQAWHRDQAGGGATSNFTDGLTVTFF